MKPPSCRSHFTFLHSSTGSASPAPLGKPLRQIKQGGIQFLGGSLMYFLCKTFITFSQLLLGIRQEQKEGLESFCLGKHQCQPLFIRLARQSRLDLPVPRIIFQLEQLIARVATTLIYKVKPDAPWKMTHGIPLAAVCCPELCKGLGRTTHCSGCLCHHLGAALGSFWNTDGILQRHESTRGTGWSELNAETNVWQCKTMSLQLFLQIKHFSELINATFVENS